LVVLGLILFGVGVFQTATIRSSHPWGDDFAMYVRHAENLAKGIPYADTGYILNPYNPNVGPITYPPLYPLVLVPVYKLFGFSLELMKFENVLFLLGSLIVFWWLFRSRLSPPYWATLLAVVGLNPFIWEFVNRVLPETLFLLLIGLAFVYIERSYRLLRQGHYRLVYPLLAGFLLFLPYASRSVGILLPLAFGLYDVVSSRRVTRFAVLATLVFGLLFVVENKFIHSDVGYTYLLDKRSLSADGDEPESAGQVMTHQFGVTVDYALTVVRSLAEFVDNGYSSVVRRGVLVLVGVAALWGFLVRVRRGFSLFEAFTIVYIGFFVFGPVPGGARYMIPFAPLFFFYCYAGLENIDSARASPSRKYGLALVSLLVFGSYIAGFSTKPFETYPEGAEDPDAVGLYGFIRENTTPDDVFLCERPRMLALYTERRAVAYHAPDFKAAQNDPSLWNFYERTGVDYIIAGPSDDEYYQSFLDRRTGVYEQVFANEKFRVLRITKSLGTN
jgi:hypothetical protein